MGGWSKKCVIIKFMSMWMVVTMGGCQIVRCRSVLAKKVEIVYTIFHIADFSRNVFHSDDHDRDFI